MKNSVNVLFIIIMLLLSCVETTGERIKDKDIELLKDSVLTKVINSNEKENQSYHKITIDTLLKYPFCTTFNLSDSLIYFVGQNNLVFTYDINLEVINEKSTVDTPYYIEELYLNSSLLFASIGTQEQTDKVLILDKNLLTTMDNPIKLQLRGVSDDFLFIWGEDSLDYSYYYYVLDIDKKDTLIKFPKNKRVLFEANYFYLINKEYIDNNKKHLKIEKYNAQSFINEDVFEISFEKDDELIYLDESFFISDNGSGVITIKDFHHNLNLKIKLLSKYFFKINKNKNKIIVYGWIDSDKYGLSSYHFVKQEIYAPSGNIPKKLIEEK